MRRTWVLLSVALAFLAVMIALELVASSSQPPDAVRMAAQDYAQYLNSPAQTSGGEQASSAQQGGASVRRISRAARPHAFTAAMGKASFADSVYYGTTYSLEELASRRLAGSTLSGSRPIPYPPTELWCVQLSNGQIIFVGQYIDLYNADWIMHEPVDASDSAQKVGCNL